MSADNSIIILCTKDGYRVEHIQAIDNIYWWNISYNHGEDRAIINPFMLYQYFNKSEFFQNKDNALIYAAALYNKIGYVEYGVEEIIYDEEFPKIQPPCCDNPDVVSISGDLIDGNQERCFNCGEYLN